MMVPPNTNAVQLSNEPVAQPEQINQVQQQVQAQPQAYTDPNQSIPATQDIARNTQEAVNTADALAQQYLASYVADLKQKGGLYEDPTSGASAMKRVAEAGIKPETIYDAIYNPSSVG